jgi:phosphoribosylformylglycinamidine synthase subunit PurSL
MPHRIEVYYKVPDARSVSRRAFFNFLVGNGKVSKIVITDVYSVDAKLSNQQIQKTCTLLANPLLEAANTYSQSPRNFDYAIEVSFLPGVTDNVGHTAKETISDGAKYKFKDTENVYSSQAFFMSGKLTRQDAKKIADSLYNPLIQKAVIKSFSEYEKEPFGPNLPKVKLKASTKVSKVDLNISDEELVKLGKLGIQDRSGTRRGPLALDLDYFKTIRDYFNQLGRKPTDVEIETLAQTWSEHCKHTIFADPIDNLKQGLYKTYIKAATEAIRKQKASKAKSGSDRSHSTGGDFCVSVFTDNAGAIKFDNQYLITHKVETHNTPSALDPFGGSVTGIVGVNRDALGFGLGAKPVINTYGFCLASPEDKAKLYRDKNLEKPMLSARRIMDGVVAGVNAGGNQSGIPTNAGFMYFDSRYRGKPLVFAGTVGLIPRKIKNRESHKKSAQVNDFIVMVGGRVGLDGIHGATFSSESLDTHSPATAVQIGDAITQKKFSDAITKEARDLNLFNSITDCGAGGLSSAVGEMAEQSDGCEVYLGNVPVKYPGLAPWQIWISESQERMVLAVPPKKWLAFQKLMRRRGVEATVIGKFTNSGNCVVKFGKQTVLNLEMNFLHNGRPIKQQVTQPPRGVSVHGPIEKPIHRRSTNLNNDIIKILQSLNITSTDFLTTQYDHEVQGGSVLKPLQGKGRVNADATITRPILTSKKGVVLSQALYPSYSELSPYNMAACAIDTAIRNAVAAGADVDYLALLDNFCWCSPSEPERLWQLKETARGCYDYAVSFGTPFISGKDSMFNDFKGYNKDGKPIKVSIPPTLLISAIGVVPDIYKTVSLDVKMPGDVIYILGNTHNEMGGSEYVKMNYESGIMNQEFKTPSVDAEKNYRLYKSMFSAIQNNLVASSISLGRGGLITAVSKMLIGGNLGAKISLADLPGTWKENYEALFSESQGRILVSVDPKKAEQFESSLADKAFARLGTVSKNNKLIITDKDNKNIVDLKLKEMEKSYKSTFKDF